MKILMLLDYCMAFIACVNEPGKINLTSKSHFIDGYNTTTLLFTQTKYVAIDANGQVCFSSQQISGYKSHPVT